MTSSQPARAGTYDGFISYSHAADDLLAPRLQAGLQKFAKQWWKRRALRLFRDEASLSANPHLWSSITEALDTSEWFVLLLSPDAASSPWVDREVEYWLKNKDPSRIIPVLTDGEFAWEGGIVSDAAPPALLDAFDDEPRWVDLRFARSEDQLDLKNPAFADAVSDLAAPMRGVPKDELASEEVRQHRRTIRTAWAAGVLVAVLGFASVAFAIQANDQRREAERQTELAEANAAAEAEARREAVELADLAEARRLVTASAVVRSGDVELAMLLALEALQVVPDGPGREEVDEVLRDAVLENRLLQRIHIPEGVAAARLSPDGETIYHASVADGVLRATERSTGRELWNYEPADGDIVFPILVDVHFGPPPRHAAISLHPDGHLIAVAISAGELPGDSPGRIILLDTSSGEPVKELGAGECPKAFLADGFSPDGRLLSVFGGDEECLRPDRTECADIPTCEPRIAAANRAYIYDTRTWDLETYQVPGALESLTFSTRAETALAYEKPWTSTFGTIQVVSYPEFEPVAPAFEAVVSVLAPSGRTVAHTITRAGSIEGFDFYQVHIVDLLSEAAFTLPAEMRAVLLRVDDDDPSERTTPFAFSPDSSRLSVIGHGQDSVWNVEDSSLVLGAYDDLPTYDHSWSSDGSLLLTVKDGQMLLWAVDPDQSRLTRAIQSGDWAAFAVDTLTRSFTGTECHTHHIDPCPSLEEIRNR